MPSSCASCSAPQICASSGAARAHGIGPSRSMIAREVEAAHELHDQVQRAAARCRSRTPAPCAGGAACEIAAASRSKRCDDVGVAARDRGAAPSSPRSCPCAGARPGTRRPCRRARSPRARGSDRRRSCRATPGSSRDSRRSVAESPLAAASPSAPSPPRASSALARVMSAPHSRQNWLGWSNDVRQRGHTKRCAGVEDIAISILAPDIVDLARSFWPHPPDRLRSCWPRRRGELGRSLPVSGRAPIVHS